MGFVDEPPWGIQRDHHVLGLRVHFLSLKDPDGRVWCCLELRGGIWERRSVSQEWAGMRFMQVRELGQGKGRKLYPFTLEVCLKC